MVPYVCFSSIRDVALTRAILEITYFRSMGFKGLGWHKLPILLSNDTTISIDLMPLHFCYVMIVVILLMARITYYLRFFGGGLLYFKRGEFVGKWVIDL